MQTVKNQLLLIALGILIAGVASLFELYWIIGMVVLLLPAVVMWLVWRVLTEKVEVKGDFEDRFYQDWEYRRNNPN